MDRSIRTSSPGRTRWFPTASDVQRHGWLIGLIAGGLLAAWSTR